MTGAPAPGHTDADAEARARVAVLLDRLTRIDLQVVVVAPPDATRIAARDRARDAAIAAGRGPLLDEATKAAREAALNAFARSGFSGTWAVTEMSVSVATARDRVAAAAAFEEAATAEIVEDLLDDNTLGVLRSTSNELADLTGVPSPGSLSQFASPASIARRGPLQAMTVTLFVIFLAVVGVSAGVPIGVGFLILAAALVAGLVARGTKPLS